MHDQQILRDLTQHYLKSLISDVSGALSPDFDSSAPFGELGIDSFRVLKIIRKLEADFGTLPKSLLFENFTVDDLASYFVGKHQDVLTAKFAVQLQGAAEGGDGGGRLPTAVGPQARVESTAAAGAKTAGTEAVPIRILETDAYTHPDLQDLVRTLFRRYKAEGCVSLGTRKIAPNLFIGAARRGYFNYGRCKDIILLYGYTGPRDYFPVLLEEIYRYCETKKFQLDVLSDEPIPAVCGTRLSATPFGAMQRILDLKEFSLDGRAMRRLRYQVSRFEKAGACRTDEYRCGTNPDTDRNIVDVIDRWCGARTMVNPLVHDVRGRILAGHLPPEHRLFLTYLDDVLQNVILITAMSARENGYLMDLEFYPPDMPVGGLEFTIVQIIEVLVAEGYDVLSMGGTYGCKLEASPTADPEIDKILDDLRAQNIFNDAGNLQFKNKFRPETKTIYLCRPWGSANPDNVIDIIMMIADPVKMQTSDRENHNAAEARPKAPSLAAHPAPSHPAVAVGSARTMAGDERSRILSKSGFNPLNVPHEHIEFDLKTDSWAQLHLPSIDAQMRHLHSQLQQPVNVDDTLGAVFPFAHFVLTASGQAAEHVVFKAWPKKGTVPQNLLFPSTIFHQIDKGFTPREIPHPDVFRLDSEEPYKGNLWLDALRPLVSDDPASIALVCVEVADNAAGGQPVSLQHLKSLKALLAPRAIPLVIDATRVLENARFLVERDEQHAGRSVWAVAREILSCADAVIGSLTKDFCVSRGGIIGTSDASLFERVQRIVQEDGGGLDLIDRKMIALSLQNRSHVEGRVSARMEQVRAIWRALSEHGVPVVHPAGGHCILIDVKQIPEFRGFKYAAASFLAWMYLNTGIRAGAHSAGMQQRTAINDLVRIAVPTGLKRDQVATVIERLIHLFDRKVNIPELEIESTSLRPLGAIDANYKLVRYHNTSEPVVARSESAAATPASGATDDRPAVSAPVHASSTPAQPPVQNEPPATTEVLERPEPVRTVASEPRPTQEVAIVGMAGRYSKARNLTELWNNLARGRDCVEDMPADRYERRLQHGSAERYRGGFIDDVDRFDSLFFNISPREAELLDPQERLFLEVAWEAIEDAGYYPQILVREDAPRNIGVFVGAVWAMYQMLGVEEKHAGNNVSPNSFLWSIANRVSYCLNLSGPSLTVDTACSSSLTALHLACEAIQAGDCAAAIVGGVNLDLHQAKWDINRAGGALSVDGVCRSFGKGANGYVAGEGVGALFLKPLEQAVKDGDHVYAVIKSAVVNHGGRTSGYTVPNPKAQAEVISSALAKAGVDARSIGYIEAHGTGTALGDPVEIAGLSEAFRSFSAANQSCAIGSIKSNIGHLEAAAGIVGVSKVLLQMKHRRIAPSLHSAELNEFIDFEHSPFYVPQRLEEWKTREVDGVRVPLRAGVSSFGAGGSNAHVILEQYGPEKQPEPSRPSGEELIFPLSARSEEQLRETAARLAEFLERDGENLRDVAHTLQMGRKSFDHRLAIVAKTKAEVLAKLAGVVAGKHAEDVVVGHVKNTEGITRLLNRREKQELIRLLSQGKDPGRIARLWAEGLLSDWQGFGSQSAGKRTSLPTYPFADRRHWAAGEKSPARAATPAAAAVHPLIDTNESTFERQLFKKTFHDRDFFIYDHVVADIPTLPGVAYLELARKAGEIAAGRPVRSIRNILWVSPIAVRDSAPAHVLVELKPGGDSVRFEVFSDGPDGARILHSQGKLLYAETEEPGVEPDHVDLDAIRARCTKVLDGAAAYPRFKAFGLSLGPSFQVLQTVHKGEGETLGVLRLPEFRHADLQSMVLHPSLVDGSLQAGVAAQLDESADEMFVPFSIGEVEILHPLPPTCFSYVTEVKEDARATRERPRVPKTNVLIVDEAGKVLVRIRDSVGVPLREIHKKPLQEADQDGFANLYYSYDWQKAPLAADEAGHNARLSMVLFDTGETLRDGYRQWLKKVGVQSDRVVLVRPGENFERVGDDSYTINPGRKDDFTRLFESLVERQCPIENVCVAWPVGRVDPADGNSVEESLRRGVGAFLFVCQEVIRHRLDNAVQLLYVYSNDGGEAQPHNEAVTGFISALHLEHPALRCKALEIRGEPAGHDAVLDAVAAEVRAHTQDAAAVRYERRERYIRKLNAFELEQSPSPQSGVAIRDNGVYVITGGAGGLGLVFAEFLTRERKARVVLTGRSALSPDREARLEGLRKAGATVLYVPADVSRCEDVQRMLAKTRSRFGEINGIIHAAGLVKDSLVRNKTTDDMNAVCAPKVHGTLHLDQLTKDDRLDFFVTFSSLAAVAGNAGQCDYAFANHFMDSFAAERERLRAKGARFGKTLSVNWSLWAEGGMKLDEQTELYFRRTLGIRPLGTATGLDAFVRGLASDRTQFAVLEGVQEKVELAWELRKKAAAPPPAAPRGEAAGATTPEGTGGDLRGWLEKELSQIAMRLLKLDASDVPPDKILLDLGFDSIGLTTFANAVNEKFQLDLTPVLFFDYPSIGEIAKHLAADRESELVRFYRESAARAPVTATQGPPAPGRAATAAPGKDRAATLAIRKGRVPTAEVREATPARSTAALSPERRFADMPIAIVGMSGVMPQSEDLDEFWENLRESKNLITVIPPDRWRWEDYYGDPFKEPNKSNSKWGGFMKEIDKFDPLFFGISPREAQAMDPQQRIFLQTVWKAIEDSGQKVSDLSGTRTGLFVGVATNDYAEVMKSHHIALDGYTASGNSHSVLANRVSFLLNLHGPSAPIDTACSSSLIALHRAIESIHAGNCDMAIVGGVQVMLSPAAYISFGMAGMLSPDGKCKTFDKQANGYVRGEGCGAIFLKPLSAAEADGNHIYAVVRASAENHGGRVTTLTAPNSAAQTDLLIEAYERSHLDPTTIGYIECHGTGTSLGDPIEIQSLTKAFSELFKRGNKQAPRAPHCALSSVKTNIGHLETAAGIASVLKVLLAIRYKQIPANIHLEEVNPYITLKGTPFYIADALTPWEAPTGEDGAAAPRRAGVSSFGFGGANAHVVLEEYIPGTPNAADRGEPQVVVLSAKNEDRLKAYVRSMHEYLGKHEVELRDLAYTLQVGRDEMPERLALVVSSTGELKQKCAEILSGVEVPPGGYRGRVRNKEGKPQAPATGAKDAPIEDLVERGDLSGLAALWVSGAAVDWRLLHASDAARRVSAPTYPFARERYWIAGEAVEEPDRRSQEAAPHLHPLVHRNVSTLREQKFASRFTGKEFYLADHRARSEPVLPAAAYMEMVATAGELSGERKVRFIRNMVLLTPLTVRDDAKEVEVALAPGRTDVEFSVRTVDNGHSIVHCRGKLGYSGTVAEGDRVDIAEIRRRCSEETITGPDLYPFLCTSELKFGRGFRVVQTVAARRSECLAVLQLPEHLKGEADRFWLHPALLDGGMHTAIGLVKKNRMAVPWTVPYSIGEVQIFGSLKDVRYAHATWDLDGLDDDKNLTKIELRYLAEDGTCLVRIKNLVCRPVPGATTKADSRAAAGQAESGLQGRQAAKAGLQSLVPVWSPLRARTSRHEALPESSKVVLLGGDEQQLGWVRESYPDAQILQLAPGASVEAIAGALANCPFDQLLWIAPDAGRDEAGAADAIDQQIIDRQEGGVLTVFRIVKALLHIGYGSRTLRWTIITSRTQCVRDREPVRPAHAAVAGLAGTLAKEYPHWDLRLLDLESLASLSARECLALPWDKQGNGLAHRHGEWFQQGLALVAALPEATPVYRPGGVYVVVGGAGGVGEVWSRFLIERHQANLVWIGRRERAAAIEEKIRALGRLGPAPLYIQADATDLAALEQARSSILEARSAIHGVVHSAIVLQDQSLARMDESVFRASLRAKVDISVNMDRVFGGDDLDFMLFFSSIVSFVRSPGQGNYAAGCTFKDSFAHALRQRRRYPVKIMNWGYWGKVGVVADESYNKVMAQMGVGSIEPDEGTASLQVLLGSGIRQLAVIKTLNTQATAGLNLREAIAYYRGETPKTSSELQLASA